MFQEINLQELTEVLSKSCSMENDSKVFDTSNIDPTYRQSYEDGYKMAKEWLKNYQIPSGVSNINFQAHHNNSQHCKPSGSPFPGFPFPISGLPNFPVPPPPSFQGFDHNTCGNGFSCSNNQQEPVNKDGHKSCTGCHSMPFSGRASCCHMSSCPAACQPAACMMSQLFHHCCPLSNHFFAAMAAATLAHSHCCVAACLPAWFHSAGSCCGASSGGCNANAHQNSAHSCCNGNVSGVRTGNKGTDWRSPKKNSATMFGHFNNEGSAAENSQMTASEAESCENLLCPGTGEGCVMCRNKKAKKSKKKKSKSKKRRNKKNRSLCTSSCTDLSDANEANDNTAGYGNGEAGNYEDYYDDNNYDNYDEEEYCDDDDDYNDEEMTEELREFLAQSAKHREERDKLKKAAAEEKKKNKDTEEHIELTDCMLGKHKATVLPPVERPGERRLVEMKELYGAGASMIQGMETAMQLSYDRNLDRRQPKLWPALPINIKFNG